MHFTTMEEGCSISLVVMATDIHGDPITTGAPLR